MPLVLEIEHLLGLAFAAVGPDRAEPEWPPQPDRVYSALVAAWAARGEKADERRALEWLERQEPPTIHASSAHARPAPASFVPPNDKLRVTSNAGWRTRQPRRFPAAVPDDPIVRLVWSDASEAPVEVLDALARDVAYVGHSASLTRCRFAETKVESVGAPPRRRVYRGRLRELERAFRANQRPSPGQTAAAPKVTTSPNRNTVSGDWLTFEIVGETIDLRAAPLACKALIKTVMSGYERTVGAEAIPTWVSGHEADGVPVRAPHLAAVPLAFAGFEHANGDLLGFALAPPAGHDDLLSDRGFRTAILAAFRPLEETVDSVEGEGRQERRLRLKMGRGGVIDLRMVMDSERASLDPRRYARASRLWATLTPLVLDRHLKSVSAGDRQAEMEALIADACERDFGVRPRRLADGRIDVVADKHAAVSGAPSAYPSGKSPRWTGWSLPPTLTSRHLTHAVIAFDEPVAGPMLIGAGRFCGLGLCLPLGDGDV